MNPQKNSKPEKSKTSQSFENLAETYRKMAPYLNLGYVWAASVILFTLLGYYLDRHWATKPWLTLTGALLGIVAGVRLCSESFGRIYFLAKVIVWTYDCVYNEDAKRRPLAFILWKKSGSKSGYEIFGFF